MSISPGKTQDLTPGQTPGQMNEGQTGQDAGSPASGAAADTVAVTQWLAQLGPGDGVAVDGLFGALYAELKRAAAAQMRRENAGHTLSATALTHEAWFRLAGQRHTRWESRGHFLAVAAIMMRRILVNHAAAKRADKRDAALVPLTLSEAGEIADDATRPELVRVHEALLALEAFDPRAAKVVELKFFGGLEHEEIAALLGISVPTVKRDWALARAWLHRDLGMA